MMKCGGSLAKFIVVLNLARFFKKGQREGTEFVVV